MDIYLPMKKGTRTKVELTKEKGIVTYQQNRKGVVPIWKKVDTTPEIVNLVTRYLKTTKRNSYREGLKILKEKDNADN